MAREWDEIDCPKCKNTIKVKSLLCPHCGSEFTRSEAKARAREHYRGMAGGCLILTAIVAGLWWVFLGGTGSGGEKPAEKVSPTEVAKSVKWDKVAILENLKSCQTGEKVIKHFVDRRDRRGAYKAAIGSKNECSRAMIEAPEEPYECTEVAMFGTAYYNDFAESIDRLDTAPSTIEGIESGKRIFADAHTACTRALERGPK